MFSGYSKARKMWAPGQCSLPLLKAASFSCSIKKWLVPPKPLTCSQLCLPTASKVSQTFNNIIFTMPIPPSVFLCLTGPETKVIHETHPVRYSSSSALNHWTVLRAVTYKALKKKKRPSLFPALHKKNGNRPSQPRMSSQQSLPSNGTV